MPPPALPPPPHTHSYPRIYHYSLPGFLPPGAALALPVLPLLVVMICLHCCHCHYILTLLSLALLQLLRLTPSINHTLLLFYWCLPCVLRLWLIHRYGGVSSRFLPIQSLFQSPLNARDRQGLQQIWGPYHPCESLERAPSHLVLSPVPHIREILWIPLSLEGVLPKLGSFSSSPMGNAIMATHEP